MSLLKLLPTRSDGWMYIRMLNNPFHTSIMIQYADWFFLEDIRLKGYSQLNNQLRRRKIWSIWKQFKHLKTTQLTWFGKWSDAHPLWSYSKPQTVDKTRARFWVSKVKPIQNYLNNAFFLMASRGWSVRLQKEIRLLWENYESLTSGNTFVYGLNHYFHIFLNKTLKQAALIV